MEVLLEGEMDEMRMMSWMRAVYHSVLICLKQARNYLPRVFRSASRACQPGEKSLCVHLMTS